jgi:uncharacterized protein (DUF433 family)
MSDDLAPPGHYLAHEVGELAGVSGNRVGQWARRGYIRSSHSARIPRIYSYPDIAEAMVVHELEDRGVSPRNIGVIVRSLRSSLGTEWPLQQTRLWTPAGSAQKRVRTVVVDGDGKGALVDLIRKHPVLGEMDLVKIAGDLERGGWAARDLPELKYIEVNPALLSGRPAIRGHRISAKDVALEAEEPGGIEELHQGYGLSDAEILDARRWWAQVQLYEAAA